LRIAKSALSTNSDAVSILAHVSVTYPAEQRQVVVVTIDYSHN